jgi:hypothetical protein
MRYNTSIIYLTADEDFVSYGTIDGYVYRDPIYGYGFTYMDMLCSGTFSSLSSYPALSALPLSAYTNTSNFSASNNIVINHHTQSEFLFTAPIIITFSLSGIKQSLYKIQKISADIDGILSEQNIDLITPSTSQVSPVSATYETKKDFLTNKTVTISCYRENFYVDVFYITFGITQPSMVNPILNYKILNYQLLDDNRNYLLTLQGSYYKDIHFGVLGTGDYLFIPPDVIRPEAAPLEFAITIVPALTTSPIYPVIPPLTAYCALITIVNNQLMIGVNPFDLTYLIPISCVTPIY